ncbi:hypothetical protein P152DRAFT_467154 [Eremomyces bilateralis CBS 781.70]|uniref:Zn(2)-C6 fungal-type domain-containing protein n=1 Tax=Eremomyces bilateralis CBS 781.70 TaxID=1392243 RepID=A0A6G1G153_9PEZI|nr:uncharacterized protein P152DRAFT_467154 [Eremomyces bilateralis CBS 781.70]KAF1811539.1 hypothetical protein P152DRAFT_467154 [Eremomyces bilateralis CBS 781.70]
MEKIRCSQCDKSFSQIVIRQKSCQKCSDSKTKCDLRRPICSRCSLRSLTCQYPRSDDTSSNSNSDSREVVFFDTSTKATPLDQFLDNPSLSASPRTLTQRAIDNHTSNTLFDIVHGTIGDFEDFCTPWTIGHSIPDPIFQPDLSLMPSITTRPVLATHSMQTLFRCLRTWPRMIAKGILSPPIIHDTVTPERLMPTALARCYTLTKMWDGQSPGTSFMVLEAVKNEIQTLVDTYQALTEDNLIPALQALVIYTIILLFPSKSQRSVTLLPESLFRDLRNVVYHSVTTGLILPEESTHERPTWSSWIHVSSKRRAIFALYLIHWSYSVYHCLPSYDCKDLGMMPAPAAGYLWHARNQEEWEKLYLKWLVMWDGKEYMQWEYFTIQSGVGLDGRAQLWLEDADEFGIMFMSIGKAISWIS